MRKNEIDTLAFLVVLGATALVALAAIGTAPAYSDDSRTDPAEIHRAPGIEAPAAEIAPTNQQSDRVQEQAPEQAEAVDTDGYEWSGSRSADQRYLWSHRAN